MKVVHYGPGLAGAVHATFLPPGIWKQESVSLDLRTLSQGQETDEP